MLLRNTKKFFQKTLNSFKSFFSGSEYQRIPKTTLPHMNIHTTYKDLDTFCTDHLVTNQWDSSSSANKEIKAIKKRSNKKNVNATPSPMKQQERNNGSFMKFSKASSQNLKTKNVYADSSFTSVMREERSCLLAEMLKELELIDMSNVDHVLDIEEFLHYYSRLTCPSYVDIVDKLFLEIYAEFFCHSATPARFTSRPKLRS